MGLKNMHTPVLHYRIKGSLEEAFSNSVVEGKLLCMNVLDVGYVGIQLNGGITAL